MIFQANEPKQKASVVVVNDKIDFNPKLIRRNRERQQKFTKRILQFLLSMHQTENHSSLIKKSNKHPKIKPILQLNSHINPHTVIVDDFNTPLPPIDMSSRQKQRNDETNSLHKTNGPHRYLQYISTKQKVIYLLSTS